MILKTYVNPLEIAGMIVKVKLREGGTFQLLCTRATNGTLHGFDRDFMDVAVDLEDIESLQEVEI